jgi:guanylate kinase
MPIDFNVIKQKPLMIVISGPSGVGKDSVIHEMMRRNLPIHFVITVNTRLPRPNEREGVDYFFVSKKRFQEMIERGELIEYSHVYEDYKGVPKQQVAEAFASGKDVIMRLDVQGAEKIRKLYPEALLIFLVPANEDEWIERFKGRTGEPPNDLDVRINKAKDELNKVSIFDYVVINHQNKLNEAVDLVEVIIKAEHHRIQQRSAAL